MRVLNYVLQVDECGLTIPRTIARMANERSVKLVFGPKRDQWQIEAGRAKEARINQGIANGRGKAATVLMKKKSHLEQHGALRGHSFLQTAHSMRSSSSLGSEQQQQTMVVPESRPAPESPLDPARLALPLSGNGREALRHELAKLQPIDDSSAMDQVVRVLSTKGYLSN